MCTNIDNPTPTLPALLWVEDYLMNDRNCQNAESYAFHNRYYKNEFVTYRVDIQEEDAVMLWQYDGNLDRYYWMVPIPPTQQQFLALMNILDFPMDKQECPDNWIREQMPDGCACK